MALDKFQDIEARLVAHELLVRSLIHSVNQLVPNAGLGKAMQETISNAIANIKNDGTVPESDFSEVTKRILDHSTSIISESVVAKPIRN